MSLESWKEEYYPVEAKDVPEKDALAHSIKKWEGALDVARYGLVFDGSRVYDPYRNKEIYFSTFTCALCAHYYSSDMAEFTCRDCPLYKVRGASCDNPLEGEVSSPYTSGVDAMLELMYKARDLQNSDAGDSSHNVAKGDES